jgi:hypothetical protein
MKRAVMGLAFVAILGTTAFADWSGLAEDQLISYFPGPSDFLSTPNRIAVAPNGTLYAAWAQGKTLVPYEMFYSKSTDNGRTWNGSTADQLISAADGEGALNTLDRGVDLAINSLNHVFVVWAESLTDQSVEIMMVKSTSGGNTWIHSDADFAISYPGGNRATLPKIAIDDNDNLHVVWQQNTGSNAEILYGTSVDGGENWSSQSSDKVISYPDGEAAQQAEITTFNNNIYVVWMENDDTDTNAVHFGMKPSGGSEFTSETADILASLHHRGSTFEPSIAVTVDGAIHVAWEGRNQVGGSSKGAIYYSRSTDNGATWTGLTAERNIDFDAYDDSTSTDPCIVATSLGKLAVSYTNWNPDLSGARPRVSLSLDGGETWSGNVAAELINHFEAPDTRPGYGSDMCVSLGDTLHVIWHEDCMDIGGSSGYYEVMYSRGDVLGIALGYLAGVLTREGGTPVPDVAVNVFDADDMLIGADVSDEDGLYSITLGTGTVRAEFSANGYRDTTVTNINIVGGDTTFLDVVLTATGGCAYVPGNINGVPPANGIDVTYGVAYFKGGNPPADICPCPPHGNLYVAADVNASCTVNGIDITYFVGFLKGGPPLRWCADCPPSR